ncbi:hypothetical protein GCM10029964_024700 [Kibdelosporangium lantanae]
MARAAGRLACSAAGCPAGLAEAIGMTRVSVNRALRALADDGIVAVEPGAVRILAPDRLRLRLDR